GTLVGRDLLLGEHERLRARRRDHVVQPLGPEIRVLRLRRDVPRAREAADRRPLATWSRWDRRHDDVLGAETFLDDGRVPVAADPHRALALREDAGCSVFLDRVVVVVEVAGLGPRLESPERLDRPRRVVAGAWHVVDPVSDALRLHIRAPDAAEDVDEAIARLVAGLDHGVVGGE